MSDKLSMDRGKIAEFLSLAESGTVQAGLNQEQKQMVNDYVVAQRNEYANAAFRAKTERKMRGGAYYLDAVHTMNNVKRNLANLATQQKAIADNQKQYLEDAQANRLSKANYDKDNPSVLADIYTGGAEMLIDQQGNIMFNANGEFKPYTQLADYALKATDTANSILNVVDGLYNSRYKKNDVALKQISNQIKLIVEEGGRPALLSLMQDNLLPGFEDIEIPDELYAKENQDKLQAFFLGTLDSAMQGINAQLPEYVRVDKKNKNDKKETKELTALALTGLDDRSRKNIYNTAFNLIPGEKTGFFKMSFKGDKSPTYAGGQYYGDITYQIVKGNDAKLYLLAYDSKGNELKSKSRSITSDQLAEELYLSQAAGDQLTAENNPYAKYNSNN